MKSQISLRIVSLGELVVDTFVTHTNDIAPLLEKHIAEMDYPVQMEAAGVYQRGRRPEETIITIQKGNSAKAVARTLTTSIPQNGKRVLRLEIKVVRFYKDVES